MARLTVFTPTYNRKELLKRVYDSLLNQTVKDFVWLIVDDGSTDDTRSQVMEWINSAKITIRYEYCENGGKMRAHNRGVRLCDTQLFVCLDSDDYFVPDAVESLLEAWDKSQALMNDAAVDMWGKALSGRKLGGIVAHKGASETKLLTECDFPKGTVSPGKEDRENAAKAEDGAGKTVEKTAGKTAENYASFTGLFDLYLHGFKGETTLMFATEALHENMFPEIKGEKYVPEDYIYDKIDRVCVLAVLDKIITVCEIVSEGYTDSVARLKRDNKQAWYLYYEQRARITPKSKLRCKYLGFMYLYAKRCGEKISKHDFSLSDRIIGRIGYILLKLSSKE